MALLAESLVEEWLNRDGYFTIRGVKHGVGEMDLLAVRPESTGGIVGWHVEVQISFRPIGYIGKLTDQLLAKSGGSPSSARARTPEQVDVCAREWVQKKFRDPEKVRLRQRLWPGLEWSFHLVHAVLREPRELEVFASEGVKCHPFSELLTALSKRSKGSFPALLGATLPKLSATIRRSSR